MTASYSASLLKAWNPNLSAYSMSIPFGEVRIIPAPLLCAFVAPSTESFLRSLACVVPASSDILLELQWCEPGNKGGASKVRLLGPGLISPS